LVQPDPELDYIQYQALQTSHNAIFYDDDTFSYSSNLENSDCWDKTIEQLYFDEQAFSFGSSSTTIIDGGGGGGATTTINLLATTTVFDQVKYYSDLLFYGAILFSLWFFGMIYYFKRKTQI